MKVCQRCGEQANDWWTLDLTTHHKAHRNDNADFQESFIVCDECRQQVFDRLSKVLTDAPKWRPPEPEATDH